MPKYRSPFYQNKQEKEKFLNDNKHIYEAMGYSENEIDRIIAQQMDSEVFSEEEEKNFKLMSEQMKADASVATKYNNFTGAPVSDIFRVFSAMYLPETSPENIQYNEQLALKRQTLQGIAEVLQEGLFRLYQITPAVVEASKNDPDVFAQHAQGLRLGFIANSFRNCINGLMANPGYPGGANALEAKFPAKLRDHLKNNIKFYEGLSSYKDQYQLYNNRYHYIIPANTPADRLDKLPAEITRSPEYLTMFLNRQKLDMEQSPYMPLVVADQNPQDAPTINFLKDIFVRVNKDRLNPQIAVNRIEGYGDKTHVLDEVTFLASLSFPLNDNKLSAEEKSNREHNRDLFKNSVPAILEDAKRNYQRPFREAAGEMASILSSGNMLFHTNEHYAGMVKLMDSIKQISRRGEMKDLSKEDKAQLAEKLQALKNASEAYMKNKARDNEPFNSKSLQRMTAAGLCCAFVKGRMRDLTLAMNSDLKAELQNKVRTHEEANAALAQAMHEYNTNPTLDTFLKRLSNQKIVGSIVKDNNTPIRETVAKSIEEIDRRMYTGLYKADKTFREAVNSGVFGAAMRAVSPAVMRLQAERAAARPNNARVISHQQPQVQQAVV